MTFDFQHILTRIERSIQDNVFDDVEGQNIELKDLSSGAIWNSFYETITAFLNTNGGVIICGIKEEQAKNSSSKKYVVTGFNKNDEAKLIKFSEYIKDDNGNTIHGLDSFADRQYINFLEKEVALVYIKPLSKDLKFVKYKDRYLKRVLASDITIPEYELKEQLEYKEDYARHSKELRIIEGASLNDLDLDKINNYIHILKEKGINESLKSSLEEAKSFLTRKNCLIENDKITALGLLLFGAAPFEKLEYRSEIDCYYDTVGQIGLDKKYFQNDVITNLESANAFVWNHIKLGRVTTNGGQVLPEYPKDLIREVINNSIAHRDYTINRPIIIEVNPNKSLVVKNPGSFKKRMIILDTSGNIDVRRIKAGLVETQNPKLANELKHYEKMESKGIGISTLVSECLKNKIDVPYYILNDDNEISLTIPSGKLLDNQIQLWLNNFDGYIKKQLKKELSDEHKLVLAYFYKSQKLNARRKYTILLSEDNNHLNALIDLKSANLISEYFPISSEAFPVYVLNSILSKEDFSKEISETVISNYNDLPDLTKQIFTVLYIHNTFNGKALKPANITPIIYNMTHGELVEPKTYETLGRKIRQICRNFNDVGILEKQQNKGYSIKNIKNN